jgi:hypothetical protein
MLTSPLPCLAFLTSLGANLRISDDELLPSPTNTPLLRATPDFHHFLPPPPPLATAIMSTNSAGMEAAQHETETPRNDPLEGVPGLSTYIATEPEDVVPALKLIADSVAQQRQIAARILIFHPLNWAVMVVVFAGIFKWLYKSSSDLPLLFTTAAGVVMASFAAVKWMSSGYIEHAESINWNWLVADDQVLITKFGDEVIGTCVLGWEKGEGRGNRRKTWGKGVVKGWAVRMRYREKGVGSALLEEAVKVVEKKGGDEIIFADDHASTFHTFFPSTHLFGDHPADYYFSDSKRVLRPIYNSQFDKKETKYTALLQEIAAKTLNSGKKK